MIFGPCSVQNSPDEPFDSSTTLLVSELCLSSFTPAPLAAQLQRICLLPSHLPEWKKYTRRTSGQINKLQA